MNEVSYTSNNQEFMRAASASLALIGDGDWTPQDGLLSQAVERLGRVEAHLAFRETQLGFTKDCAVHGADYSDSCGACSVARRIATYESVNR